MSIAYADRKDCVEGLTGLSIAYAWARQAAGESLAEVLAGEVPLRRLTVFQEQGSAPAVENDTCWRALLQQLLALFEAHRGDTGSERLEAEALALLWPHLEPRIQADVEAWPKLEQRPFGFFTYDWSPCSVGPDWLSLHLANPFAPRSPFEDMPARFRELTALLEQATAEKPQTRQVQCGSWLNRLEPFLAFFPASWVRRRSAPGRPNPGLAWWGQFVDRSGRFHRKNGEYLRRHGAFPFPFSTCACRVEELRGHLQGRGTALPN